MLYASVPESSEKTCQFQEPPYSQRVKVTFSPDIVYQGIFFFFCHKQYCLRIWLNIIFISYQSNSSEKAIAPHSSTLTCKIPRMEEPGGLQSMGSLGVGHDWAASLSLFTFMHWRRRWQPPPVFLPGESQGWGSPVGCRLWGRTESDTTKVT